MLPYRYTCSPENFAALRPEVLAALTAAATAYQRQTGQAITVTSAGRTLRHCAELMAAFNREQLEAMYCRRGYPDYIRQLVAAAEAKQAPLSADEAYDILRQRREGYISYHLFGAAVDIATKDLHDAKRLTEILTSCGFAVSDETHLGIPCLHASYTQVTEPLPIIRV
ncbi:MAG: hypothetical protein BWX73_01228 [Lentisphaerae bacterium ADurb.Bin082]|nr:MAG: hypothetical protein BWX73_01228 [Lentisphaerae bacterium ADurb.Bin082]